VSELEFRVFGTIEVWRRTEPVVIGRGSTVNLLAGLLVSANTAPSAALRLTEVRRPNDLGPFPPAVCTVLTGMRGREMALSGWTSQPRSGRDAPAGTPFPQLTPPGGEHDLAAGMAAVMRLSGCAAISRTFRGAVAGRAVADRDAVTVC
jgi:hypothetical protein